MTGGTQLPPVAVTAQSFVSSIGNTEDELILALKNCKRGLTKDHRFKKLTSGPLGIVNFSHLFNNKSSYTGMECAVLNAVHELAEKSKLFERYRAEEIGFLMGTTTAGIERAVPENYEDINPQVSPEPFTCYEHQLEVINRLVRKNFPIRGFSSILATACSGGALAIKLGQSAIVSKKIAACIVGGFDILCPVTIAGFSALQILDQEFCIPFEDRRAGINLSDGGGFLLLEAQAEQPLAYFLGSGASSDGFHMTKPEPDGRGMEESMNQALVNCNLKPSQISYINAHGTGTLNNDTAESAAIHRVFGHNTPVSSTKRYHGHALAGTGALEAIISIAALRHQIPWASGVESSKLLEKILFADGDKRPINYVVSNSFGFGGSNVSLVFGQAPS